MKITRIKAICKAEKHCIIYEQGESRRLIGTRNAAYPADELNISRHSLKTLFDWPDVLNDIGVETVALEETRMHPMSEWHSHLVELTPCWTVAYAGEAINYPLDKVFQMNVEKLKERYPDGFDPERSRNRKEGDV